MALNMCRLCLSKVDLVPMFTSTEQSVKFSDVLAITTGLNIQRDDGLPQKICLKCTDLVNMSLKLRTQSNMAISKLFEMGLEIKKSENTTEIAIKDEQTAETDDHFNITSDDSIDFDGIKIEIEVNRLSEDGDEKKAVEAKETCKQPVERKRKSMYMNFVEGVFNKKGPVKCKICKKSLANLNNFSHHVRKQHQGCKVLCEFCGKEFVSAHQLNRHCRSYHGMERNRKCKHCSYLALDKAQLMVHERRVHTGDRPYACNDCGAAYFNRKCLLQHIESHRVTASVQCDQCDMLFKSRRHLSKHKYGAHTDKRRERRRKRRSNQKHEVAAL